MNTNLGSARVSRDGCGVPPQRTSQNELIGTKKSGKIYSRRSLTTAVCHSAFDVGRQPSFFFVEITRWPPERSRYRKGRSGLTISRKDPDHMTAKYSGIDGYVGNTPLIRLRRLSELTGCEILGKAEFMDPARLRARRGNRRRF